MAFKMKGHTLPGINQRIEGKNLPDGRAKSSAFQDNTDKKEHTKTQKHNTEGIHVNEWGETPEQYKQRMIDMGLRKPDKKASPAKTHTGPNDHHPNQTDSEVDALMKRGEEVESPEQEPMAPLPEPAETKTVEKDITRKDVRTARRKYKKRKKQSKRKAKIAKYEENA